MPDQIEALIAEARFARGAYPLDSDTVALIDRMMDALCAAHTVIEEAKAAFKDYGPGHAYTMTFTEAAIRRILNKFPGGGEPDLTAPQADYERITPSEIVARFSSLSSGTVRSIIQTGQALIDERMADGVFE